MVYVDLKKTLLPFILPSVLIIIWFILTDALHLIPPYILPSPLNVVSAIWKLIIDGKLLMHTISTIIKVFSGIILASVVAIPLGILLGWSHTLDELTSIVISILITLYYTKDLKWKYLALSIIAIFVLYPMNKT